MAKSKKKKSASAGADSIICSNRRATFDYSIEDRFEAGLVLVGSEVKSPRAGKASISEAYARLDNRGELWLEGAHIAEYPWANRQNHETNRRRKMLMNRQEIHKISGSCNGARIHPCAHETLFPEGICKTGSRIGTRKETARQTSFH